MSNVSVTATAEVGTPVETVFRILPRDRHRRRHGVTTFTVEPDGDGRSTVTIATHWHAASGFGDIVDRSVKPLFMRRLYRQELRNPDEYARRLSEQSAA